MKSKIKLNKNLRNVARIVLTALHIFIFYTAMKTLGDGKANPDTFFILSFVILAALISLVLFTEPKKMEG